MTVVGKVWLKLPETN